uniref:DUF4794 domain-containing protein n=1 Tax=Glossina pallidipes TaxID=7398 RepID=A0A1A9ZLF7_GLOPL
MWLQSLAFVAILLLGLKAIATSQAQVAEVSRSPRAIDLSTFVRNLLLKSAAASDLKANIKATPGPRRRPATTLRPLPSRAPPPPPQFRYNPNVFFQKSSFGFPFNIGYDPNLATDPQPSPSPPPAPPMTPSPTPAPEPRSRPRPGKYFRLRPTQLPPPATGEPPASEEAPSSAPEVPPPPAPSPPPSRRPIIYRPNGRLGKPSFFSYDYNYDDYDSGDPNPTADPPPSPSQPPAPPMTPPPAPTAQPRPSPGLEKNPRLRPTQSLPPATEEPPASEEPPSPVPEESQPPLPPLQTPPAPKPKGRPPQQLRNQLLYRFAAPDDISTNDAEPPAEQPQPTPDDPNGNSPAAPDAIDDTGDFADSRNVFSPENASEDYIDDNSNNANNDGRQFLQPSRPVDFANGPRQSSDSAPIFDTQFPSNGAALTQPSSYESRFPTNLQYQYSYGSAPSSNNAYSNPFFEGFNSASYQSPSSPDYNLPYY